jgi:Na+-driven multidrug efflux pump
MSVAPIAGQNFGARHADRVRHTFRDGALLAATMMLLFFIVCHLAPSGMIRVFTRDPAVIAVGSVYLRIVSWSFLASGVIFVAGSMFQAMGNTIPSIATSLLRIVIVAAPVIVLSRSAGFELTTIWHLSVVSVWCQLALALLLLRREFARRLAFTEAPRAASGDAGRLNLPASVGAE